MNTFKVGDKVRCIWDNYPANIGRVCTVAEVIDSYTFRVNGSYLPMWQCGWEKVAEPTDTKQALIDALKARAEAIASGDSFDLSNWEEGLIEDLLERYGIAMAVDAKTTFTLTFAPKEGS